MATVGVESLELYPVGIANGAFGQNAKGAAWLLDLSAPVDCHILILINTTAAATTYVAHSVARTAGSVSCSHCGQRCSHCGQRKMLYIEKNQRESWQLDSLTAAVGNEFAVADPATI